MMEHTFVILKPSVVVRGLMGKIIERFENKGFKIVALKMVHLTREKACKLYAPHEGKPFHEGLIQYMISAPVVILVLEGRKAVSTVRNLIGTTDATEAQPGTIRGDFAMSVRKNLIHAADSKKRAEEEIRMFFEPQELLKYKKSRESWIY